MLINRRWNAKNGRWLRVAMVSIWAGAMLAGCTGFDGYARPTKSPRSIDARRAAWTVDHEAYRSLGYRLDWRGFARVSGRQDTLVDVLPEDDLVVTLDRRSAVTALEMTDGSRRWWNEIAGIRTNFNGLARAGEKVLALTDAEAFVLDAETGTVDRRVSYGHVSTSQPLVVGGLIVYGTFRGELRAVDIATGVELWANAMWGQQLPGPVEGKPVWVQGAIGAVTQNGEVFFIEPSSGTLLGRNRIGGGLSNRPIASGSVMIVASLDQSIYAFDTGGRQLWRYRTANPITSQPASWNDMVYCHLKEEGLVAFDASSGEVRWRAPNVSGEVIGVRNGRLFVWDGSTAMLVDPAGGGIVERAALESVSLLEIPGFEDGPLIATSEQGVVGRFIAE